MRTTSVLTLIALTLSLAACGGSSKKTSGGAGDTAAEAQIRQVLSQLQTFSRSGNGQAICKQLFTPKLVESIRGSARTKSCAKEIRKSTFTPKALVDVQSVNVVDATNAVAQVLIQGGVKDRVLFSKYNGRWLIRGIQQQ